MALPVFPDFKHLEITDKEAIENITNQYPPYSDFNFVSMWSWDTKDEFKLSILNDNLVVKFLDYKTDEPFYSFIGKTQVEATIAALLDLSINQGLEQKLKLIPEDNILGQIESLEKHFQIEEDPDNFDYIYDIFEKSEMFGEKYLNRRKIINKFQRGYPGHTIKQIDITNEEIQRAIEALTSYWADTRQENVEQDIIALHRLLLASGNFELVTLGTYHKDKLIAFFISQPVDDGFVVAEFAKSDIRYKGVAANLSHQMAILLKSMGYKYLNYEQDLGIPGLRNSKLMWHPSHYLKKYTICIK